MGLGDVCWILVVIFGLAPDTDARLLQPAVQRTEKVSSHTGVGENGP
jgi:hypothetical protein